MGTTIDLRVAANDMMAQVKNYCEHSNSVGSMSVTVYDTAWLAMLSKTVDGVSSWLFPEAFTFVLQQQQTDGSWPIYKDQVDGILNTAAALLALQKHRRSTDTIPLISTWDISYSRLDEQINNGCRALKVMLTEWDVSATAHVGFEYLVPTLLSRLREMDLDIPFHNEYLEKLGAAKLAKLNPELLYGETKHSALFTLEAFIGKFDFDRVKHHLTNGSMLGSPSSTAAYLMNCSSWDNEAEEYLQRVVRSGSGQRTGAAPSAFPSTNFEMSWVVSTLLDCAFSLSDFNSETINTITEYLGQLVDQGSGLIGYAPGLLPSSDDTAKVLLALSLLNNSRSPDALISTYETDTHFRTFLHERNPSLSANCNILTALLSLSQPNLYITSIRKCITYICSTWESGSADDKWNLAPQYTQMLLLQSLLQVLQVWDQDRLDIESTSLIRDRILPTVMQVLLRFVSDQALNGSWGEDECCETTAYGLISLVKATAIPLPESFKQEITTRIELARNYLSEHSSSWKFPAYKWITKLTYKSPFLSQAYCIAAMKISETSQPLLSRIEEFYMVPFVKMTKIATFFSQLPLFASLKQSPWKLEAAVMEGYLYLARLRENQDLVFNSENVEEDRYMEYIPPIWTCCNMLRVNPVSNGILWHMMMITMLNYQADAYMEAISGSISEDSNALFYQLVKDLNKVSTRTTHLKDDTQFTQQDGTLAHGGIVETTKDNAIKDEPFTRFDDVRKVLSYFIQFVNDNPAIQAASKADRALLRSELCDYLLAHIAHTGNSRQLEHGNSGISKFREDANLDYYQWVHTTAANDISLPYGFAFFTCLLGSKSQGEDCFISSRAKYLSRDLCRHLATMSRQYNDHGSVQRDAAEHNLNSINFSDFWSPGSNEKTAKEDLFFIAEYERSCMEHARMRLEPLLSSPKKEALRLFADVADLYAQLYVARDLSPRLKTTHNKPEK